MSSIIVQRGHGWRYAPDITAPLATGDAVKVARGKRELDEAEPYEEIQLEARYHPQARIGKICEWLNMEQGEWMRGKITYISISIGRTSYMRLTVRRSLV